MINIECGVQYILDAEGLISFCLLYVSHLHKRIEDKWKR